MKAPLRTGTNPVKLNEHRTPTERLRVQRMARVLRLTGQMLSNDLDSVSVVEGKGPAPAWTKADGSAITIDFARMPKLNGRRDLAVWLGTYAHELFHNLFTPRTGSLLMRRVVAAERTTDPGIHRSWNVLEDQRIERLGLSRFAPWRGYLIAALSHHIAVNHPESWLLLAGRTWISDEARSIARATFVATNGEAEAQRVAQLIGAYQRLTDPGDDDAGEAWAILSEFHGAYGQFIPPKGACGGAGSIEDGEPEQVDDNEVPYPTADEADDEDDDESESEGGQSDDDDDDDDSDGDGDESDDGSDDDGESDGDDDGDGEDSDESNGDDESDADDDSDDGDDGDANGESDAESDADDDFDPGDGTGKPGDDKSITEAIEEAIDEALGEDETADDLDSIADSIENGPAGGGDLPRTQGQWIEATQTARLLARDVTKVLADIKDDCEAAWIRRTDTGKFSVERWATDPGWDADNVFDLFDPGAMDASSLDLVLVLDVSGSMTGQNQRLAEATWAIRHAVDRCEGTVTCLGFGTQATLMFDKHQRPDGRMFLPYLEDATYPAGAIRDALRIVSESTAANRIVIVLTDGQWYGQDQATAALKACGDAGAVTAVVGLGRDTVRHIKDGFANAQHIAHIADSAELVPFFKTLAEQSMRASVAGR